MTEIKPATFKEWVANQYELDELKDIYIHGCESGCAGGLIYYSETNALYDQFADEIHEIVYDYFIDCGGSIPNTILDRLGCLEHFKNQMVWCCAEIIASEIVNMQELA